MHFYKKCFSEAICMGLLILSLIFTNCLCDERRHRVKRWFFFNKNSKLFARLNGKDNLVPFTTFFTHGWGFRINYDLPDTESRKLRFFKRDIHTEIDNIDSPWGKQAYSCIMKYLCETIEKIRVSKTCGMFCEIGNIISESRGHDADFFLSLTSQCDRYNEVCPYQIENSVPQIG